MLLNNSGKRRVAVPLNSGGLGSKSSRLLTFRFTCLEFHTVAIGKVLDFHFRGIFHLHSCDVIGTNSSSVACLPCKPKENVEGVSPQSA